VKNAVDNNPAQRRDQDGNEHRETENRVAG
jgi:hypothetical protein